MSSSQPQPSAGSSEPGRSIVEEALGQPQPPSTPSTGAQMARTYYVYASPKFTMSSSWASIADARYVPADKARTGASTWVVVPGVLDPITVANYELELRYGPIVL